MSQAWTFIFEVDHAVVNMDSGLRGMERLAMREESCRILLVPGTASIKVAFNHDCGEQADGQWFVLYLRHLNMCCLTCLVTCAPHPSRYWGSLRSYEVLAKHGEEGFKLRTMHGPIARTKWNAFRPPLSWKRMHPRFASGRPMEMPHDWGTTSQ